MENPAVLTKTQRGSHIGFGKKRGRKEEKGQQLTASAVFHELRIPSIYVCTINGV